MTFEVYVVDRNTYTINDTTDMNNIGELKYFYSNYRDYYYLPIEDTAIHKSVGEYVDKTARVKATARTCYTRKQGLFLPQFEPLWSPSLKEDYKAPLSYTPYCPEMLSDAKKADAYARQLLSHAGHAS